MATTWIRFYAAANEKGPTTVVGVSGAESPLLSAPALSKWVGSRGLHLSQPPMGMAPVGGRSQEYVELRDSDGDRLDDTLLRECASVCLYGAFDGDTYFPGLRTANHHLVVDNRSVAAGRESRYERIDVSTALILGQQVLAA